MDLLPAMLLQQKLEYYLHHPRLLVPEVRKEFEYIIRSLSYTNVNLRDQDVRAWRKALKDLEDKVDYIMILILSLRSPMLGFGHHQLILFIFQRNLKKQLKELPGLGEEIQKIQTNGSPSVPDNASESTQAEEQSSSTSLGSIKYGVRPSAYDMTTGTNATLIHADVVNRIEDLLLNYGDKKFKVIGVIERKGIGKSRLVTYVYQNEEVKKFFDCYAWISNPLSSQPENILREMLRQFYFGSPPYTLETMDQKTLLSAINKCLVKKRFLLVLDGVSDSKIWGSVILPAFPFGGQVAPLGPIVFTSSFNHGRIVFTSNFPHRRNFDAKVNQVYVQIHLKALMQEETRWDLFCQLVFTDTEPPGSCPLELEGIARRITEKSGGLPFVIRLLAGLSIFPKDIEIPLERVIRLWVAEGLVEENSKRTAIETSMAYLQELINRELIQPGHVDVKGDLKSCKFDDQIRRVALDIIGSNVRVLVQATDNGSSRIAAGIPSLRLLSIQGKGIEEIASDKNDAPCIRSCIISGISKLPSSIMRRFQLLRVLDLDLDGSDIKTLPNSLSTLVLLVYLRLKGSSLKEVPASVLKNLIRLRYLGLRRTGIRELPASLLQLNELHTLDVRETKLRTLPHCVSRLPQLRHIYLCSSFRREVVEMPLGKETAEERLLELQTLAGVRATTDLIEELGRWTQLRKLSIGRVAEADSEKFCDSIDKMNFLRSLSIRCEINETLHMGSLARSMTNLDTLRIGGSVEALNSAINCFQNRCCLFLWDNLFTDDPLPMLQRVPKLMVLSLANSTFQVKEISCDTDGFPELKTLSIFQLRNLENWKINGLQKLEYLSFGHCPDLKEPPQNLEKLLKLQLVKVAGMDEKFNEKMEKIGKDSKYSFKVRSIPLFKHDFGATEQKHMTKHEEVSEASAAES
ncbi:disease resistance protein RPM1-like [Telopea speciosissima]|uniref:disease resistance protein RPM1-like n=1 Tax=Telopea speciosissima TaxID=54955 RepID=UPI001CC76059|nr:disease resistance protein RPM1-like [Telopea speciosissima]